MRKDVDQGRAYCRLMPVTPGGLVGLQGERGGKAL